MSEQERQYHLGRIRLKIMQLHLTVIDEKDFQIRLGSYFLLLEYRDNILDDINFHRRVLGIIQ